MPTYEFACPSGHRFDRFYRKISDAVPTLPCPECGAEAARQLSGGAGLIFKGSGFYITDYGKDGKKSPAALPKAGDTAAAGEKGGGADAAKSEGSSSPADKSSGTSSGGSGGSSGNPKSSK